jgi:hypothetical protein
LQSGANELPHGYEPSLELSPLAIEPELCSALVVIEETEQVTAFLSDVWIWSVAERTLTDLHGVIQLGYG